MIINRRLIFLSIFLSIFLLPSLSICDEKTDRQELRKQTRALLKKAINLLDNDGADSALFYLDSILSLDDNNPDAHYYSAKAFLIKNDTAAALNRLTSGIALAPHSSRLKILKGRLILSDGQFDDAITLMDEVLRIKPNELEALYYKGTALMSLGDSTSAYVYFEKAFDEYYKKSNK